MSYKQKNRISAIVNLFVQNNELSVKEISELMDVSDMTVRRDLDILEKQKVVKRTHGGAVLVSPNPSVRFPYILEEQTTKNTHEKNLIGLKAASLVQPNETIFLDSGSTTPFIAKNLSPTIPITVLCYTFTNAMEFYPRENTNLILLGGFYHRDSKIFHSDENYELIRNTRADKAFISTAGLDPEMGLTTFFNYEAATKREMIRSARHIVLVADSTKFGQISVIHFAELNEVQTIITDNNLSEKYRKIFVDRGIELIIADNHNSQYTSER